jgi:SNF2 family DNA or RNA helicase
VIGELDWSPAVQLQNIGRIARDGQPHPVAAYIPLAQTGCDPTMADVLGLKRAQAEAIVDPDAPLVEHLQQVDEDRIKKLAQAYLAQSGSSFSASKEEPAEVA